MADPRFVAIIDVGKTNAKLALVDTQSLEEIAVEKRANTVLAGPPWPHFDLEGHWRFFLDNLKAMHAAYGIDAISVTTHGASAVLLDAHGNLAAPMLDYEHPGPDSVAEDYERVRPPFAETGSPRLGSGLNVGAQLFWQFRADPDLLARTAHILTYPQYWGFRLTGHLASDMCSLGCHTDLWNPWEKRFSLLVEALGIADKMTTPRRPFDVLGTLCAEVAAATGMRADTPVSCGIHDSNASLLPYLLGHDAPFAVVSTGTWVIVMAVGGVRTALDPARDTLVNVNAYGEPVPSARFMGGREYEIISGGEDVVPTDDDRQAVLARPVLLLPAVEPTTGPFMGREARFTTEPQSAGQKQVALSYYLALMTSSCLDLTAAAGPVIVEGPFAHNAGYCAMLAALRPAGVRVAKSTTGTSIGSALLLVKGGHAPHTDAIPPTQPERLRAYARTWQGLVDQG